MADQLRYTQTRGNAGSPTDKVATPAQATALIMREAQRRGLSWFREYHAAGISGSLMQESGNFRRDVICQELRGDAGTAYGAAQWRGPRQQNLNRFLTQNGFGRCSLEGQISFVFEEMDNGSPYKDTGAVRALNEMRSSGNLAEAATAFIHFERPAGYGSGGGNPAHGAHDRERRINHAVNAFNGYTNGDVDISEFGLDGDREGPAGTDRRSDRYDLGGGQRQHPFEQRGSMPRPRGMTEGDFGMDLTEQGPQLTFGNNSTGQASDSNQSRNDLLNLNNFGVRGQRRLGL